MSFHLVSRFCGTIFTTLGRKESSFILNRRTDTAYRTLLYASVRKPLNENTALKILHGCKSRKFNSNERSESVGRKLNAVKRGRTK